jgi:hypothetical protein
MNRQPFFSGIPHIALQPGPEKITHLEHYSKSKACFVKFDQLAWSICAMLG